MRGVVAFASAALLAWGSWGLLVEPAVEQPIQFPHQTHLALKEPKFECTTCHDRAERAAAAGRPSTKRCLSCHSGSEAKSAEERKLQAFGEKGQEIPWQRVWRLPPHVRFSHRIHVTAAKILCQSCHGPVETLDRPPTRPLRTLAMADCIGCHEAWRWPDASQANETAPVKVAVRGPVSTDCNACHR